jgi:alkylation response protein AidB-like acyl-CoA dehydrogenase
MNRSERRESSGSAAEFVEWLDAFLPVGYYDNDHTFAADWQLRRDYQVALFEAGWLQPHWEPEFGGRSLTPADSLAVRLAEATAAAPKLYAIGSVHVVAPTLRTYGTDEQRARLLVPALRGDERWCLGMSEPESGSDLASLRTRGRIEGDTIVVDGRKIWTSQAHWAKWCLLYCRTDATAPKHRGISCVALDMELAGVTAQPIRMADDKDEVFCEVDFVDVRAPREAMIGSPGDGWRIVTGALTDERDMLWLMNYAALLRIHASLPKWLASDPDLAPLLGRSLADVIAIRATGVRARAKEARSLPNPEFMTLKLLCSESLVRAWDLVAASSGATSIADTSFANDEFEALTATIYGGTSEVQRDIVGERALGLPRHR